MNLQRGDLKLVTGSGRLIGLRVQNQPEIIIMSDYVAGLFPNVKPLNPYGLTGLRADRSDMFYVEIQDEDNRDDLEREIVAWQGGPDKPVVFLVYAKPLSPASMLNVFSI